MCRSPVLEFVDMITEEKLVPMSQTAVGKISSSTGSSEQFGTSGYSYLVSVLIILLNNVVFSSGHGIVSDLSSFLYFLVVTKVMKLVSVLILLGMVIVWSVIYKTVVKYCHTTVFVGMLILSENFLRIVYHMLLKCIFPGIDLTYLTLVVVVDFIVRRGFLYYYYIIDELGFNVRTPYRVIDKMWYKVTMFVILLSLSVVYSLRNDVEWRYFALLPFGDVEYYYYFVTIFS
jgi:hypothetical protein